VSATCHQITYKDGSGDKTIFVFLRLKSRDLHVKPPTIQRRVLPQDRLCILLTKMMTCLHLNNTKTGLETRPSLYCYASNHVASTWNHQQYKDGSYCKTIFVSYWRKLWRVCTLTIQRRVWGQDRLCIVTPQITWPPRETTNNTKTGLTARSSLYPNDKNHDVFAP